MTADLPPTRKQLVYLRRLAQERGQTFVTPTSRREASAEIDRLKATAVPEHERHTERRERKNVIRALAERDEDAPR
jgi:hypothetical protein